MTEPTTPRAADQSGPRNAAGAPLSPAPTPAPAISARPSERRCDSGTPDWLRLRFSDGFAAHELG